MTDRARAILLLPSGFRALDEDLTVPIPAPGHLTLGRDRYRRLVVHGGGLVDSEIRALYVLGGAYEPNGFATEDRPDPSEAYDQ